MSETTSANEEKFKWTYSEKHTRLRYQTVLASVLFASAQYSGIAKLKFPFVDFIKPVPAVLVLLSILTFYVFSAFSLIIRTINEENKSQQNIHFDFANLSEISSLITKCEAVLKQNIATETQAFDKIEKFKLALVRLHLDYPDIRERVSNLQDLPKLFQTAMSGLEPAIKGKMLDDLQVTAKENKFGNDMITDHYKFIHEDIERNFKNDETLMLSEIEKLPDIGFILDSEKFLKEIEALKKFKSGRDPSEALNALEELDKRMSLYSSERQKYLKRGKKVTRSFFTERRILGFYVPLLSSYVIILTPVFLELLEKSRVAVT